MISQWTILITLFLSILIFILPRKYFLLPFILGACFVPTDQRIIIMGLDFTVVRLLIIAGMLRIFLFGEIVPLRLNYFDKLVLAWALCGAAIYVLQWASFKALINRCGYLYDILGMYWIFRQRIRSFADLKQVLMIFAVCAIMLAPLVAVEWTTGKNPFEILGKVNTSIREGRFRCQAAFPHSIMLGLFWANLIPIFFGMAKLESQKIFYWAAIIASVFIICATASSTPLATFIYICLLLSIFRYRIYGKSIVYAICGILLALQLVMNHPVWHLIMRANIIGGSTGWHRFHLIDRAIGNFGQWAILGTRNTASWGAGLVDVTNQYILEGVRGGAVTLVLFVMMLVIAVKTVGKYSIRIKDVNQQWFIWGICVSILGHCMSFIGASYFGQIMMLLYLELAMVGLIYEVSLEQSCNIAYTKTHFDSGDGAQKSFYLIQPETSNQFLSSIDKR